MVDLIACYCEITMKCFERAIIVGQVEVFEWLVISTISSTYEIIKNNYLQGKEDIACFQYYTRRKR